MKLQSGSESIVLGPFLWFGQRNNGLASQFIAETFETQIG